MALQTSFFKKTLHFAFKARTSRGSMKHRDVWYFKVWASGDEDFFGIGEAGPLPGLSHEKDEEVEKELEAVGKFVSINIDPNHLPSTVEEIHSMIKPLNLSSSVTFAAEVALLDLKHKGSRIIFKNDFLKGVAIPINGLVWMGGLDEMLSQVSIKIDDGFNCIKLKIGGTNFEKEVDILQFIRRKYFRDVITIRLDANGAFKPSDALYKLADCARHDIQSIEQPVKAGSTILPELCRKSPIPIGLDEELIGIYKHDDKIRLLERILPQFIVLKPTVHGGLESCKEWIKLAEERKIGWWLTSAMESNIGLNAIAQFTAEFKITTHQGLGTGMIYSDNIPSPLEVYKGGLRHNSQENWDLSEIN